MLRYTTWFSRLVRHPTRKRRVNSYNPGAHTAQSRVNNYAKFHIVTVRVFHFIVLTYPQTYMATKWSQYRRRHTVSSAPIIKCSYIFVVTQDPAL